MSKEVIEKLRVNRLRRKAKEASGLREEIKNLRKQIVMHTYDKANYDVARHKAMINKLKLLKAQYDNVKAIHPGNPSLG